MEISNALNKGHIQLQKMEGSEANTQTNTPKI